MFVLLTACAGWALAQPLNDLVFTVGTTIQDGGGHDWSYVPIGAPQPQLLAGKRFAVFGKPGVATSPSAYTLRGTLFQQTDPAAVNTLLSQSVALNENLASLTDAMNVLLHAVPGATNLPLNQKILTAFQVATGDPLMAQSLLLLSQLHPGLRLAAGQAFAEQITTTTTYEIRDVDLATGVAGAVVGRVTITPGAPVVLPAPGFPFQVVTNAPSDHLRVRLRWGTPDALRRLSLLQYGFNVWRIPAANAIAAGYQITPPTPAQLFSDANFVRVNPAPVMATRDYAPASPGGPDDLSDRVTYFFSDNNGRLHGGQPFADGTNFFYFITARDILGRDGLVSPGGLATACRRLPPSAPTDPRVANSVVLGSTNRPVLLVTWLQDTNPVDLVTHYLVYRWPNPSLAFTNDVAASNYLVGVVAHLPGTNRNAFMDTAGPTIPGASNYWYTVRGASPAACTTLLSPHSPPAWGVVRQRAAPVATTGELLGSCGTPMVIFQSSNLLPNPGGLDATNWHYRLTCQRRDSAIAWVTFYPTNQNGAIDQVGPVYFAPDSDTLSQDYALLTFNGNYLAGVGCVVGTYYGLTSQQAMAFFAAAPAPDQIQEAVFLAGDLLLTALSSTDPLFLALSGGQRYCVPGFNVQPHADGTVSMRFDVGNGTPMLIQTSTNGGQFPSWTDLGVAMPDRNGVYWVYWEPCLVGPLPPFRGCRVDLPGDGDCSQHVTSTGDGSVAPIRIKFFLTPRTHEYRLYRRVDDGPLTLIAQGAAVYDPFNPTRQIVRTDDAMPPSRARICYFVQVLDENGNGSPMALIGCRDVKPPKPPRPVLGEPLPAGDTNNPLVALNWFCPTGGVYRFEIKIERADQPGTGLPTGFGSAQLIKLTSYNTRVRYAGLFAQSLALARFDESQLTPPVGASFGPGPQFKLTASVVPNVPYRISVAAQDDQGNSGDPSQVWTFTWKPPLPLITVPWPARPLPPFKLFDEDQLYLAFTPFVPRVRAVLLYDANGTLDYRHPVGIRIGDLGLATRPTRNVGTTNPIAYLDFGLPGSDPNNFVFRRQTPDAAHRGESLLPIVVYRQQVTNSTYPRVSGNITQVTPLLERIAYTANNQSDFIIIWDGLLASNVEYFNIFDFQYVHQFLYLRDQQPVILGASYQYYVVRLNDQREVSETIPAGVVTIPSSP